MEEIDRRIISAFMKLTDENKVKLLSGLPALLTQSQSAPAASASDRKKASV